ncbi:CLUMA_CG013578, isoform A [Clunio marinus]|uniref:CLUMA_CG013578, isoform A n=1 Tax=Clunio marinus TaxID=568069 RepID=A0A1J1IP84_9DIPT|nr:CLUMA_CG013578, isoform A [Clunio marinus]
MHEGFLKLTDHDVINATISCSTKTFFMKHEKGLSTYDVDLLRNISRPNFERQSTSFEAQITVRFVVQNMDET